MREVTGSKLMVESELFAAYLEGALDDEGVVSGTSVQQRGQRAAGSPRGGQVGVMCVDRRAVDVMVLPRPELSVDGVSGLLCRHSMTRTSLVPQVDVRHLEMLSAGLTHVH